MTPKVTVLMAVYNGHAYLKECIDSVLSQTHKDFEFLVVDDSSTDNSKDFIRAYRDSRIRLIENEKNMNQVKSLNIGLDRARGEYIARIDQDDIMAKDRLERQVDFLDKRTDISVVGTWSKVIDEKGKVFARFCLPIRNEEMIGSALFCGFFLAHPSVAFRKDVIMKAGKYNETVSFSEDYDLWTRLLLKKHRLANIPAYLIKFRYHGKSSSRKFSEIQINNVRTAILNFIKAIDGNLDNSGLNSLCDILINTGLMNKEFWSKHIEISEFKKALSLLNVVLMKIIAYFNFKSKESYLFKRIFLNRILNFAYQSSRLNGAIGKELYLYCLKNCFSILEKPKLYLYPLAKALSYLGSER